MSIDNVDIDNDDNGNDDIDNDDIDNDDTGNDDTGKNENEKNDLELLEAAREAASLTAKGSIQVNHLFKGDVKKQEMAQVSNISKVKTKKMAQANNDTMIR